MSSATRPSFAQDLGASAAVAAFSLAVAAGFARVFSGWTFLVDLALIILGGHGVGLLLRRTTLSSWLAVPLSFVAVGWLISAIYYPETMAWGLPTAETWNLFEVELLDVREQFRVAVAPVIYGGGWDVLAAIGVAIAVLLADVFAFRADARAEALVPGGVLFVFVGSVGDERLRIALAVALVAVGVMATAVLRVYHAPVARRSAPLSLRRLGPAIVATALIVAATAGFVGPRLPGADAAPLYATHGGGTGSSGIQSQLVDIKSRLTNQETVDLFQVRAEFPSYWRTSALAEFDGSTWSPPSRELATTGEGLEPAAAVILAQQITILDLRGTTVPVAAEFSQADRPGQFRWNKDTAELLHVDEMERGDMYDLLSAVPRFDPATLAAATNDDPGDPIYTQLPDDLPDVVRATAEEVTAGAQSPFEAALALQSWFRDSFEYSLELQKGHDNSAIESFLRGRVGYCEQFAGTYAAMMRSLGHPARVSVGYSWGNETTPGTFVVQGRNAHAWPEVWFDDVGWVLFEPTPGRAAPGAEDYTGLEPEQAAGDPAADEATEVEPTTPPLTDSPTDADLPLNIPEEFADPTGGAGDTTTTPAAASSGSSRAVWVWLALALIGLIAVMPAVVRRVRSRAAPGPPAHQVARLWRRSVSALTDAHVPVEPSQTPNEMAAVATASFPVVSRPVTMLAEAVTAATYGADGASGYETVGEFGSSTLRRCQNWERQIERAVQARVPRSTRIRRYFTDWG